MRSKDEEISEFVNSVEDYPMLEITYEVFQLMVEKSEEFSIGPVQKTVATFLKRTINENFEAKRISNLKRKVEKFIERGGINSDVFLQRSNVSTVKNLDFVRLSNNSLELVDEGFKLLKKNVLQMR